jgi:glycosyltransferase involved in cell wall biosynthesis
MRLADHVVAISDSDRRNLLARGFRPERVTRIHNGTLGFDPTDAGAVSDDEVRLRSPSVLTVAGMNHRKGIADLIAAVDLVRREIPEVRLYLAGHGSERALFEAMAAERGLAETVTFLGFRADPRPLYPQADVFVLASRAEPFGLALLEARAAGCAIVGTDVDGIPEVLAGGRAGRLVPPRDPARLATAITELLRDSDARAALGRRAQSDLDYWSVERMVDETLALYRRLLLPEPGRVGGPRLRARHADPGAGR